MESAMAQVQALSHQTLPQSGSELVLPVLLAPPLYVGDLEPSVSEAHLYEIFSQIGTVLSIRVCRDSITRRSLKYAYVNYRSANDAMRALDVLNFTHVRGKPIRIMYSHRDSSVRKSGAANIFIKNLDSSIDNRALYDTFINFGPILSCKVATDCSGQSRGYGFVQFEQEEDAQNAIVSVNGMLLNDKQVFVGPFVPRGERAQASAASEFTNVYVKNLVESTTEEELGHIFRAYGNIASAVVMRDIEGKSKCFGFVDFEHPEDAATAVAELNGKQFNDKKWYVGRAQKKAEREEELRAKFDHEWQERLARQKFSNLYLKHLDDNVDDERLRELFADFGTITSCKVTRDPQGRSRGSGFVAFSAPEEASRAMLAMNSRMVGTKPLYVAVAQSKEERRAMLAHRAQSAPMQAPQAGVAPAVPASMHSYYPAPGLGNIQQMVNDQHPHGIILDPSHAQIFPGQYPPWIIPPLPTHFGDQQHVFGGQHSPPISPFQPTQFGDQQQQMMSLRHFGPGNPPVQLDSFEPVVQRRRRQRGKRAGGERGGRAPQKQTDNIPGAATASVAAA